MLRHVLFTVCALLALTSPLPAQRTTQSRISGGRAASIPEIGRASGRTALTLIFSGALLLARGKRRE